MQTENFGKHCYKKSICSISKCSTQLCGSRQCGNI